jgi:AbrB family looped-hinge helix DNA binding protein
MKTSSVTISSRGAILLPLSLRKEMELKPGTQMLLKRENDTIVLQAVPSFTRRLEGLTKGSMGNTPEDVAAYIDDARGDREA